MSTTIDSRVVEMRFDNKHFESNVSTTMSTLEKLKQKLNLTGAAKGLQNIDSAAKKVNMTGLGNAAETVGLKFNAMYTMADQALRNITNRVQHAAESMVKVLTIDPVNTGLSEYETQIGAVQTILANTQHNGTTLDEVNGALDTLNTYADKTIYNFTEMTRNIGTFTAAGVDLKTSVESIQGIANLAAVSGSTSQQASTAMYQLSQALAAGKVSLMDWNSVVNAGMGGKVFQDALVRTSELLKTGAKDAIKTYGSFRESLTKGEWLTTEVLTETLKQLSGAYTEADLIAQGFTEKQAKEITDLAKTAQDAATKVKTVTQLWDTLKEAAQSGWTQTWELIIGDFDEAKELWSGVSDTIGEFINNMSESRNQFLGGVLKSPWKNFNEGLQKAGVAVTDVQDKLRELYDGKHTKGSFDKLVEKHGSFEKALRSGAISADMLKEAVGKLNKEVQNLDGIQKNLKMGDTGEDVKKVQQALTDLGYEFKKYGVDGIIGEETEGIIKAFQKANGLEITGVVDDATIAKIREMSKASGKLASTLNGVMESLVGGELGGREKIIESFKNIWQAVEDIIRPVGQAFRDIFPPMSVKRGQELIDTFYQLTEKIKVSDDTAEKIHRTFKGLFAIADILTTLFGGGLKIALKAVNAVLGYFGTDILTVTANVGDAIVGFRDWLDSILDFDLAFETLADGVKAAIPKIQEFFNSFIALPNVSAAIENIKSVFSGLWKDIKSYFTGDFDGTGKDLVEGLANGIKEGAPIVWDAIVTLATELLNHFCGIFEINSPSRVMFEMGQFIVQGLVDGIKAAIGMVVDGVTWLGTNISNFFKGIDWEGIFGTIQNAISKLMDFLSGVDWSKFLAIIPIGAVAFLLKMLYDFVTSFGKVVDIFAGVIEGFENIENAFADVLKSFSKTIKSYGLKLKAEALDTLVNAILKLVGAVIVLSYIPTDQVYSAVGVLIILSGLMVGITFAMDKLTKASLGFEKGKGFNAEGFNVNIIAIAACMLLIAKAAQMIGKLDPAQAGQAFVGLLAIMGVLIAVMYVCGDVVRAGSVKNIDKIGSMMIKLSLALILMVGVCKLAGSLTQSEMENGALVLTAFLGFILILTKVTTIDKNNKIAKLGGLLLSISVALILLVGVCKLAGKLTLQEFLAGAAVLSVFLIFVKFLVEATRIGKEQQIAKLGGIVLAISTSLILLVAMCKLAGMLSVGEMIKGAAFMIGFGIFVKALVSILKIGNEQQIAKVAGTLLAMSIAIGILAGIAVLLSFVPTEGLIKGVAAVSVLGVIMAIMTKSLKGANNVVGSIVALSIAVAVMAGAVAALTFIDGTKMAGAVAAISIVMLAFGAMAKMSGQMQKATGTLIVMAIMVGVLGGILYLLSGLPIESSIGSAIALSILLNFVTKAMKTLKTATPLAKGSITSLILMTGVLVLLGGAVKLIQMMNIDVSIGQAIALSILLMALAAATKILASVGPVCTSAIAGAAALAGVILILGGLIVAVGALSAGIPEVEQFLDEGIPILEKIGVGIGKFIGGFIGGIASGAISTFPEICGYIQEGMSKIGAIDTAAIEGGKNLIEAMAMLAGASILDTVAGWLPGGGDPIETFKENVLAFAGVMTELSTALSGSTINTTAITQLAEAGTPLATLNKSLPRSGGWVQDIVGAQDLGTFGESVKAFAGAMIEINNSIGSNFTLNETAMTAMCTAGTKFVELNKALPRQDGWLQDIVGEQDLTTFGASVAAFAGAMLTVNTAVNGEGFTFNEAAFTAMATAGTKFTELNAAMPKQDGWIQDILGEQDLTTFGASVKAFAEAMIDINTSLDGVTINTAAFYAIAAAGAAVNTLQTSLPKEGGWWQEIMGSQDITTFGDKVKAYAEAMVGANTALADVTINTAAFNSIVTAGTKINELQSVLPKEGGWWQEIVGKTDISDFGEKIKTFAESMAGLRDAMGENGISESVVTSITNTGNALVALNDTLPEKGWFDTKEDLTDFSEHIKSFAEALGEFSEKTANLNSEGINLAISTANRLKTLIDTVATIDTSGVEKFTGIGSGGVGADGPISDIAEAMADFSSKVADIDTSAVSTSVTAASKLKSLINGLVGLDTSGVELFKPEKVGSAIKTYADKVSGIDTAILSSSISAANKLKNFIGSLAGLDNSGIEKFKLGTIGSTLKTYGGHVASMNSGAISSSVSAANKLKNFIGSLAGLDTSGVGSFTSAISKLGTVSIDSVVKAFSGSTSKLTNAGSNIIDAITKGMKSKQSALGTTVSNLITQMNKIITGKYSTFKTAGSNIIAQFVNGITSNKSKVSSAMTSSLSSAVTSARGYYSSFYNAGSYLVSGFASGISANTWRAEAKAKAMANAAERAAKEALDINSPSRVFAALGSGVVEGFVKGIDDNVSDAGIAASGMADVARTGFGNAISKINDFLSNDIDTQPTIRPVLDLSEVETGAGAIAGMFSATPSVGVLAKVGSINSMMNARVQNGGNSDVISAINKLGKSLGNIGGTSYNINGITYDDGTNVSEAVQTLVRAARIERRI